MGSAVTVVHVDEAAPDSWSAAIYLCGPTPVDSAIPSWRPAAVRELRARWRGAGRLVVFVPEPVRAYPAYADQVAWENAMMRRSDVVLFFVPRRMPALPGLVSNIKWGAWHDSGRAVLGAPADADRMEYLRHQAAELGVPVAGDVPATCAAALELLGAGARRRGGERAVPLPVWRTGEFQRWYGARRAVGDVLVDARVERSGRGGWSLWATVRSASGVEVSGRVAGHGDRVPVLLHGRDDRFERIRLAFAASGPVSGRPGSSGLPVVPAAVEPSGVAGVRALIRTWTGLDVAAERVRIVPAGHGDPEHSPSLLRPCAVELTDAELDGICDGALRVRTVREGAADFATWGILAAALLGPRGPAAR
ncbi:nucleoside 2-deoxyribosyltransferase domain-containing protein [Saccharopolyspora gregorii]|uniref:Uncharacterized protein n=1 Tax=Saccharopolyspora gregorii TaxID=33914 RepID=A0ABP6RPM3_9PSEU|nr:nucleoside 2-deoxyribosyltransferase domain-containing protein [Saccharopolyspora gregorii]